MITDETITKIEQCVQQYLRELPAKIKPDSDAIRKIVNDELGQKNAAGTRAITVGFYRSVTAVTITDDHHTVNITVSRK